AILKFEGVDTCNDAEDLVGYEVWVAKDALPDLSEDEFYWHDFEGLKVVTEDGMELGSVTSLLAAGPYDILVVTGRGHEYMIPARNEFIAGRDGDTLIISPPDGLLDINN
ncbi:MAG: ribosome maturation factor RimM, partial [Desulfobulbaceae bacterium]|nr:ribosome maturation factor RimM [Desulfobulbaceae bacterium]